MASIWDFGENFYGILTGGKSSARKAASTISDAEKKANAQLAADTEAAKSNLKSSKELYQLGKETASAQAGNKAGIAKKNAKAAAMQSGGSRLMSAIQGAEAANAASQEGFDTGANQAMGLEAQNQQNRYNADIAAAQQKAANTMAAANAKANVYNQQAQSDANKRSQLIQTGAYLFGGKKNG